MLRSDKKKIISKFATHPKDTGSPKVQVAILTERINKLQEHLITHSKDNHSRKGLLEMVGKRRKHLNYLRLHDKEVYEDLLKLLKLKGPQKEHEKRVSKKKQLKEKVEAKVKEKAVKKTEKKAKKATKKVAKKTAKK
jgi:small subunit ribosomal protein S15